VNNTFFIDRRTEEEINSQIKTYVANIANPPSRTLISTDDPTIASYPLAMSLNRVVRFLATKTNLLDEKYFRFITDKIGLFPLPPQSAVAPVSFTLTKGYDQAFVPRETKLGIEKENQVCFQTSEDLVVRNNSIKSVTVEDHNSSKTWKVYAENGDVVAKVLFNDSVNRKNIIYRQNFTVKEKVKKDSVQFLQFTGLSLVGVQYSFDKFTGLFHFLVNGMEVAPVHFNGLFDSGDRVKIISDLGLEGDTPLNPLNIYLPINIGDADQFEIEIASKDNLKSAGVTSIGFGSVRLFQFAAPTGVVIDDAKIVVGADSKHFFMNAGNDNLICLGATEALSTIGSIFKAEMNLKVYWEGIDKKSSIFRNQEIDFSLMGGIERFFQMSQIEYYDGVFWTPVQGVIPANILPVYDATNKKISWSFEFRVPAIGLSKIGGIESRWIRMTIKNTSESLGDTIFSANSEAYQAIKPWARITNIFVKKVVEDSFWDKKYEVGNFSRSGDIDSSKPLDLFSNRTDLVFEVDRLCDSHILDWYIFIDPQNKDHVTGLKLKWDKLTEVNWTSARVIEDRTTGLTKSGRVILNTGPDIFLSPKTNTYFIRMQVVPGDSNQSPTMEDIESLIINGVYNNTVEVEGVESDSDPRKFSGTGEENQVVQLGMSNVLGLDLRIIEPIVQSGEAGLHLAVNTKSYAWNRVENFYSSSSQDRHFLLEHNTGALRFGDGTKGKVPPRGSKNIIVENLRRLSLGVEGVEAGEITKIAKKIPGIKECKNIFRATGYRMASNEEKFYGVAPQKFKHSNRPVTFSDFEQITLEAFSEVYSCRSFLDTSINRVKVIVVPRNIADLHTNDSLLSKIDDYLISYCVSNHIKTCYPDLVSISIKITTTGLVDEKRELITRALKERLSLFFDTVRGGQDGQGWQVGRNVYKSEISWAINDILGSHLHKIEFPHQTLVSHSYIKLGPNEFPDISDIEVVGDA
jgi:hypothetical protein